MGSQPIRAICVKEEAMAAMASRAQGTLAFNVASRQCVDVFFQNTKHERKLDKKKIIVEGCL